MSSCGDSPHASWPTISPITLANLNARPDPPPATTACSCSGWRPSRKCSSGVFSKRHVFSDDVGPAPSGK